MVTGHHTSNYKVANTANAGQPELTLRVASELNPGIWRKDKPNEDCIFATHGFIASTSDLLKPFALFVVADGMGGLADGKVASQLAVQTLDHIRFRIPQFRENNTRWFSSTAYRRD